MKFMHAAVVLALAFSAPAASIAAADKPAAKAPTAKPAKETVLQKTLREVIERNVREVSAENDGDYPLEDTLNDEMINAKLKGFIWSAMRDVSKNEKIVRAEFHDGTSVILVDYTLRLEEGSWEFNDETIISIDGVERFVYNDKHERRPVRKTVEMDEPTEEPLLEDEFSVPDSDGDVTDDEVGT